MAKHVNTFTVNNIIIKELLRYALEVGDGETQRQAVFIMLLLFLLSPSFSFGGGAMAGARPGNPDTHRHVHA